ncbi:MAG: SMI1/KNR4 family protein [Planctomycetia bacterium]|nr:SMI1/KNR4 family protein [Planctomycetia bacterium]
MAKVSWSQLPKRIEMLVRDGEVFDRPKPGEIDNVFRHYEAQAGFRLPISYREFIHWFGPGALSGWFQICAPIPPRLRGLVADVFDMDKQREMLEDPEGYWADTVTPETLRRLVLFASTEGGDWFFWDTADARNSSGHEYGVYGHSHSSSSGKVKLMATSFKEFVTEIGLGDRYPFSTEDREAKWNYRSAWPTKQA